ncbi:hypothetical protein HYPSUDRAFT_59546 [Hypholoma sublateritium FD-334 SS-4]|uniref:Uncharacterized protein n=1 Tax=Hypholoma sublateritium (strain FD-334 SS-4) TaxID=945553 RepID=A0A0D2LTG5_HYPSF|nr:hypothetical protein HYPSUDRAFT_59546 [Hypholoma sublateritium FD-334 SS-4]
MEHVRNLASFKDISEKVTLLEAIKAVPGTSYMNYFDLLESLALLLKWWSGLAAVVTTNPDAMRLVMVVQHVYHSLSTNRAFVLTPTAREFIAFHAAMVKINPSLSVHTPPSSSPGPPSGPMFSDFSNISLSVVPTPA